MRLEGLLLGAPFAHRGLWRPGGAPENSLAAFKAACAAGYGIELDVRLSADGEAVVFHDETLERMTAESGLAEERTADELAGLRLLGSTQFIPALADALAVIGDRTPVLVELKTPAGQEGPLEEATATLLRAHVGPKAVLSFNRAALAAFAVFAPDVPRGLNCGDGSIDPHESGVDFLSVAMGLASDPGIVEWRRRGRLAVAWTARSLAEFGAARPKVDNLIFEGFEP